MACGRRTRRRMAGAAGALGAGVMMMGVMMMMMAAMAPTTCEANVLGIDVGAAYIKAALVAAGKPLDIVLNLQSKRKTESVVGFNPRGGERLFGSDATGLLSQRAPGPTNAVAGVHTLLGVMDPEAEQAGGGAVQAMRAQYLAATPQTSEALAAAAAEAGNDDFEQLPTLFFNFQLGEEERQFSVHELTAMMLNYVVLITENHGGKTVRDCVLTVPSYWTQHERQSLLDAAEIAKLKVIGLIDENVAVALQYGTDRMEDEPLRVMFYNMGAASTQVTIAEFHTANVTQGRVDKTVGAFRVLGHGWDTALGGQDFDARVIEILADRFNEKWGEGKEVRDVPRAMAKIRKNARKVKEVLSANQEIPVWIESLHDDIDFNTMLSRAELEEAAADLFERVTAPIEDALRRAGLNKTELHAVELLGGGVRVPRVQQSLREFFGDDVELGSHMNGDESMALGAGFHAANHSKTFKTRKVLMDDVMTYPVRVHITDVPDEKPAAGAGGKTKEGGSIVDSITGFFSGSSSKDGEEGEADGEDTADATKAAEGKDTTAAATEGTTDGANEGGEEKEATGETEDHKEEEKEAWEKQAVLYSAFHPKGTKKTVTFQHGRDLSVQLSYHTDEDAHPNDIFPDRLPVDIGFFNVSGISAFAKDIRNRGLKEPPKVHLSFMLDSSGMVKLLRADASAEVEEEVMVMVEVPEDELTEEEKALFANEDEDEDGDVGEEEGDDDEEGYNVDEEDEEDDDVDTDASTDDGEEETAAGGDGEEDESAVEEAGQSDEEEEEEEEAEDDDEIVETFGSKKWRKSKVSKGGKRKKPRLRKVERMESQTKVLKRKLRIVNTHLEHDMSPRPLSRIEIGRSQSRLASLDRADQMRREKEEAKNSLESMLYSVRGDMLDLSEDMETVSTQEQRDEIVALVDETEEWLYGEGDDVSALKYRQRSRSIRDLCDAIAMRARELKARPIAVEYFHEALAMLRGNLTEWETTKPQITDEDRGEIEELMREAEDWMAEKEAEQKEKALTEAPAFYASDIPQHLNPIEKMAKRLARKPKPKPKKEAKKSTNSTKSTTSDSGDEESADIDLDSTVGGEGEIELDGVKLDTGAEETTASESTTTETDEAETVAGSETVETTDSDSSDDTATGSADEL